MTIWYNSPEVNKNLEDSFCQLLVNSVEITNLSHLLQVVFGWIEKLTRLHNQIKQKVS